jgi:hypothetical protein
VGFRPAYVLDPATETRLSVAHRLGLRTPRTGVAFRRDRPTGRRTLGALLGPELMPGRTGIADQVGEHQHRYLLPVDSHRSLMPEADNIYQSIEIMSGV